MEIQITNDEFKDKWDYQRAKYLLEIAGLGNEGINITQEQRVKFETEITKFLWAEINKQFPQIGQFCNSKRGGFNKPEEKNHNTPIICIHGSFYMQLVGQNTSKSWIWKSID